MQLKSFLKTKTETWKMKQKKRKISIEETKILKMIKATKNFSIMKPKTFEKYLKWNLKWLRFKKYTNLVEDYHTVFKVPWPKTVLNCFNVP